MAWNLGPGAVLETCGDAAWDVVKNIPGIGDYYTSKGATDSTGALGVMLGDLNYMVTGNNEDASYVQNYYQSHGGVAQGIVDGVVEIGSYVKDNIGTTWHSIFG